VAKRYIVADFETASPCDLPLCGAWRYAEDVNTEVLCLCWRRPDGTYGWWVPGDGLGELLELAEDPDVIWVAHNAGFEKAIWRRIMVPLFGLPDIPDDRWHDTQAVCAAKAIPLQLEKALHVLGLPDEKDMVGSKFTIGLSHPNKAGYLDRSPATIQRVVDYCIQDDRSEFGLHRRIGWLEPTERETWLMDQEINQRGVRLDRAFIANAQRIVTGCGGPLLQRFAALTAGYGKKGTGLTPTQTAKFQGWMAERGCHIPNLQKETVAEWLGSDIDGLDDDDSLADDGSDLWDAPPLTEEVAEALKIRQIVGSASVKKLPRMQACLCADGRARGVLQYHAAGPGRWAGRLFQPQNFPRPTLKGDDGKLVKWTVVFDAIMTGDHEYVKEVLGSPVEAVVSGLRHCIIPSVGNNLAVGDFAGIEARIVLALAGQYDKCDLIAAGMDPYCDFAGVVLGRVITKKDNPLERQNTGKPGVLGCGFGMGARKLSLKEKLALSAAQGIVDAYRKVWAPLVPKVWYGLEAAATMTVWTGKPHEAFGVRYALEDGWLTARLPSDRKLWYWNPKPVLRRMPWDQDDIREGFTYQAYKKGHMITVNAYGGLLTENVVQALARDIMVHAMKVCRAENYPIVLTVHDEIIADVLANRTDDAMLKQMMEDRPQWAIDMRCPIEAETWVGDRYRK
jgi:DNA polymerase